MSDSLDLSSLTGLEIRALSMEVITSITPERFAMLTIPQLHALTSVQLTWLTGAQWDAMLPTQKSMLFARFALKQVVEANPQSLAPAAEVEAVSAPITPKLQVPLPSEIATSKPAVSAIASRFMNPSLMTAERANTEKHKPVERQLVEPRNPMDAPIVHASLQQTSANSGKRARSNNSFSLAHSAVYVAVITLLTSGDFLSTAYSRQAELLSFNVTSQRQPKPALNVVALPPGLVMPPESAVVQANTELKPSEMPVSINAIKPEVNPVAKTEAPPVTTVAVLSPAKSDKWREALVCTESTVVVTAKTALEEYMAAVPRKSSVVSLSNLPPMSKPVEFVMPAQKGADPDRYNTSSWTSISQATDLPPRIAALGEDLISVVVNELPSNKSGVNAMSFEEFKLRVKEAVVESPDLGIVSSQLGQSQASKSLAGAGMLPQVAGTAESGRRNAGRDPYIAESKSYDRRGTNIGFSISQLVFDFGSALSGLRAGEARLLAQQELLNSKKSEQALKTISAFVELERAKAQLKLARQNANSRLSVVKLVKERSEIGGGTKADLVRVESKYAEALSTISLMETRLSNAEAGYREAFGVSAKDIVNGPLHEFAIEGLNQNAEELANAYPGLQQLARLREASLEDYKSVSAKSLPSLQMVYNNNLNGLNGPTVPADSPSRSTSTVFQLKYEFYTGGADTARKTEALYKSQQAWEEFQSGMRQYQKVLSQSQAEIRNNEDLIAARKASANSAINSMRAVREQFSFNRGSLLDLITVQEGLYQAGRDLIDASADRILVRYRLLHLTSQLDKMFDLGTLVSMNAKD
jgi:outer membrane protein TolC